MRYKLRGFSAVELVLVLPIIIGLILMTNVMLSHMATTKRNNQLADQIRVYQKAAIMYLNDSYRDNMLNILNSQENIVVPAAGDVGYLHVGVAPVLAIGQTPCLYITKEIKTDLGAVIKAYLIFGNSADKFSRLSYKDAIDVANAIGGSSGVMLASSSGFKVQGLNFNEDLRFSYDLNIGKKCGFSGGDGLIGIPNNSIIIDLTRDKNFFKQLVPIENTSNEDQPKNPSLQKFGTTDAIAMQTNLYLDNIINESSLKRETYCSASDMTSDPNSICEDFAKVKGFELIPGSCVWDTSSIEGDGNCLSTVRGNYIQKIMGCNNANFGDANRKCLNPNPSNGKFIQPGTVAYWTNKVLLSQAQCVAHAMANYQTISCNFTCVPYSGGHNIYSCGASIDQLCNKLGNSLWPTATGNMLATNLQSDGRCLVQSLHCRNTADNYGGPITTEVNPITNPDQDPTDCGVGYAIPTADNINQLGYISGGVAITPPLPRTIQIPADHRYRELRLGNGANGSIVSIKSDAPTGAAITTSQLDINHAGIKTGVIELASHNVAFAAPCASSELGKIAQQNNEVATDIQAQLRCTYSLVACSTGNYCYLPVKSASRKYIFNQELKIATCPNSNEFIVDPNQPKELLDTAVKCPDLSSQKYRLSQDLHGEMSNCYEVNGGNEISFCITYQSACSYFTPDNTIATVLVPALKGVQCIAKNYTFVVNNYISN